MCVLVFSTTFLILRTERDMIINEFRSDVKYPLLLTDFNETAVQPTQDIQI
jgi:hypothetical protein